MTDIIKDIELLMFDYEINTGFKPTRLYLGRQEMLALGQWAFDNGYQDSNKTAAQEGKRFAAIVALRNNVCNSLFVVFVHITE